MLRLTGYQIIEQIHSGTKTQVYQGKRLLDQKPVVIKVLRASSPNEHDRIQLRNQYMMLKELTQDSLQDCAQFIQPYSLEAHQNGEALVMEDFGAISLKQALQTRWKDGLVSTPNGIQDFLTIAIQLASMLATLARHGIIHKDIKPANLVIHPITQQVKLIDFSIATRLTKEVQELKTPNSLEGTLPYISPEQTGRMNRGIDYRTDFYSLGITLYEVLTGQLPFVTADPMELIYCHLAQQPPIIEQYYSNIPPSLSAIIHKLMAKNAEDRYQTAFGLKHDLESCLQQWQATGSISSFELGQRDFLDSLIIPETLYGRETEVATLLATFDRVAEGATELMLIAGGSGVGKTAMVREIYKPITRRRSYFIQGKYDQLQRDVPFSAIVQAFRGLVEQLLTESRAQVEHWRSRILEAVEENGQVILDLIPEAEWLIGAQPKIAELEPAATQHRLHQVFQKFVQSFLSSKHPLVLFLDDLQWADSASLKLIQVLMSDTTTRHLLLIGAYRDNEVSASHSFILAVEAMQQQGTIIHSIALQPLEQSAFNQWIADTVRCSTEETHSLTQLLFAKTRGNPFFTAQLLKLLYEEAAISFDSTVGAWRWSLDRIQTLSLTEDVVEFLGQQLQKLPQTTQTILTLAACIGNRFDLGTLAVVCETPVAALSEPLFAAIQAGLVSSRSESLGRLPCKQSYQFLHDRIQQAAYALISEEQRSKIHLKIGQLLSRQLNSSEQEEKIFEIVNHLNKGIELIVEPIEREALARLNLKAGRKAEAATAYQAGLTYFKTGVQLLTDQGWQTQYELTLNLYTFAARAAYLEGDFEQMQSFAELILQSAQSPLDCIQIYEIKLLACIAQNRLSDAILIGQQALQELGIQLPQLPTPEELAQEFAKVAALIPDAGIEALLELPLMTDATRLAAIQTMNSMTSAAYLTSPMLFSFIVLQQVQFSIVYGNAPLSACAYSTYGLLLCGVMNDLESGYQFGQLALKLASTSISSNVRAKVSYLAANFTIFWKQHLKESLPLFQVGYQEGLEVGELEYAAWSYCDECEGLYLLGHELTGLEHTVSIYRDAIKQIKQDVVLNVVGMLHQSILNLVQESSDSSHLTGDAWNEQGFITNYDQMNPVDRLHFHWHKLILSYQFENYPAAWQQAKGVESLLHQGAGQILVPIFYFYDSLTCLALASSEDSALLARVSSNQDKMSVWARYAPMNYEHKYCLVEAERCRVLNQRTEAMEFYDRAIDLAKEQGYLNEEALSYELAAKFYLAWEKPFVAQTYFQAACQAYQAWGAIAKLSYLEQQYPQLLLSSKRTGVICPSIISHPNAAENLEESSKSDSLDSVTPSETTTGSSTSISEFLDIKAILKASQALSVEIELEKLLITLMQVLLENAGAESGALLLQRSGSFAIEAQAMCNSDGTIATTCLRSLSVDSNDDIPSSLINYVSRSGQTLVMDDATIERTYVGDPYIARFQPKSIACVPVQHQGKLLGILYLENRLVSGTFTRDRLEILKFLTTQAAISLENAMLYDQLMLANTRLEDYSRTLEQKVSQRTKELNEKNQAMQQTLQELNRTQTQLIQSEKMSSLGQMVAGLAHEINNPITFIHGNTNHAYQYTTDLLDLIELYQQSYPNSTQELAQKIEEIDLEFLKQDLPTLLNSIKSGSHRIRNIVLSLRNFARLDESEIKPVDIHDGIESTLVILQHKLKTKQGQPDVEVIKDYAALPEIMCYASQINQVLMNLITNAIDALKEKLDRQAKLHETLHVPRLHIQTSLSQQNIACIQISDNGDGIPIDIQSKIFDPFFTTKPVGSGTGLGLSIAYQIVAETHQGRLSCDSIPGQGTVLTIEIPIQIPSQVFASTLLSAQAEPKKGSACV